MKNSPELITRLANELDCTYLSDLHAPALLNKVKQTISHYHADDYRLKEWQEAVNYILDIKKTFDSCEEAKNFLLNY